LTQHKWWEQEEEDHIIIDCSEYLQQLVKIVGFV
jgi:hypothetical protein